MEKSILYVVLFFGGFVLCLFNDLEQGDRAAEQPVN